MSDKQNTWRLGEILVQNGWITWDQLEKALETQKLSDTEMAEILVREGFLTKKEGQALNLGEILVRNGWISWQQLKTGLEIQRKTGRIIGEILVEKGFLTRKNLYRALAIQFEKAFVDFERINIPSDAVRIIPKRVAYENKMIPLLLRDHVLLIAVSDPKSVNAELVLSKIVPDYEIRTAIAAPEEIEAALKRYYGPE